MTKRVLSAAGIGGLGVVTLVLAAAQMGHAQVSTFPTSDRPAGYVVFAKVVVDTTDLFDLGRRQDTVIQLTNTGQDPRVVECFYVDATNRCNNALTTDVAEFRFCRTSADCREGGQCLPQWSYINFTLLLTADQPVGWTASSGTNLASIDGDGSVGGLAPYFLGELKCFEVDGESITDTETSPLLANDLKGEATIYDLNDVAFGEGPLPGTIDVRSYNAIGFQAQATLNDDQFLCLGRTPGSQHCNVADYASCPSILVVDHFFDGAEDPNGGGTITTDLTLVPCTEDLSGPPSDNGVSTQTATTAQILVFNEFEQRLSTNVSVDCFRETQLSRIDKTAGNEASSIFNFAVQGTLSGQTRIRPVLTGDLENGNGLLAVAEEFHTPSVRVDGPSLSRSAAFNVDYIGTNSAKGDIVRYSVGTGEPTPTPLP